MVDSAETSSAPDLPRRRIIQPLRINKFRWMRYHSGQNRLMHLSVKQLIGSVHNRVGDHHTNLFRMVEINDEFKFGRVLDR